MQNYLAGNLHNEQRRSRKFIAYSKSPSRAFFHWLLRVLEGALLFSPLVQ